MSYTHTELERMVLGANLFAVCRTDVMLTYVAALNGHDLTLYKHHLHQIRLCACCLFVGHRCYAHRFSFVKITQISQLRQNVMPLALKNAASLNIFKNNMKCLKV